MRHTERGRDRQREKQAPRREPDVGLDPRSPRIMPWTEGGAKPLGHPGCLAMGFLTSVHLFFKCSLQTKAHTKLQIEELQR